MIHAYIDLLELVTQLRYSCTAGAHHYISIINKIRPGQDHLTQGQLPECIMLKILHLTISFLSKNLLELKVSKF